VRLTTHVTRGIVLFAALAAAVAALVVAYWLREIAGAENAPLGVALGGASLLALARRLGRTN
jgi:hypothetical protein